MRTLEDEVEDDDDANDDDADEYDVVLKRFLFGSKGKTTAATPTGTTTAKMSSGNFFLIW